MRALIIVSVLFLCGCHCKYFHTKNRAFQIPVLVIGQNYNVDICENYKEEITIGITEEEEEYVVSEDSIGYGYVAVICYLDRDTFPHIIVGVGSEFDVGKCRFRVIEVFDPWDWDTVTNPLDGQEIYLHNKLALQVIKAPNRCSCANRSLRKYDQKGLEPDWLQKAFSQYWR